MGLYKISAWVEYPGNSEEHTYVVSARTQQEALDRVNAELANLTSEFNPDAGAEYGIQSLREVRDGFTVTVKRAFS